MSYRKLLRAGLFLVAATFLIAACDRPNLPTSEPSSGPQTKTAVLQSVLALATQPATDTSAAPPAVVASPAPAKDSHPSAEWPRWLGPYGNGISDETGLLTEFPEEGPTILWRAELGTGYSGISVVDGRCCTLFGRDGHEYVGAFDAADGTPLWKVELGEDFAEGRSPGPRSTPCIDGNRVYVLGASGNLACLDLSTGKVIWQYDVTEKLGIRLHEEGLSPSPLADQQQVIVVAGRSVYSLDKLTGEQKW